MGIRRLDGSRIFVFRCSVPGRVGSLSATCNLMHFGEFRGFSEPVFVASVVLQVVGELKDIELCLLSAYRAASMSHALSVGIWLVQVVRRCCFLPALATAIPVLVCFLGGDALSVCFNTIVSLVASTRCV